MFASVARRHARLSGLAALNLPVASVPRAQMQRETGLAATVPQQIVALLLDTTGHPAAESAATKPSGAPLSGTLRLVLSLAVGGKGCLGEIMQYLPGWTVQCINPQCAARGRWLRANFTGPFGSDHCSNCGAPLQSVPPPLAPRLRMRPRPLTAPRPAPRPR